MTLGLLRFHDLPNEYRPRLIPPNRTRDCASSFLRAVRRRKEIEFIDRGRNRATAGIVVRRNIKRTEDTHRLCPRNYEAGRRLRPCVPLEGARDCVGHASERARSARS